MPLTNKETMRSFRETGTVPLLWKIRCIIARAFRGIAIASMPLELAGMIYLGATNPAALNQIFSGSPFNILAIFFPPLFFEGLGRLLSWIPPNLDFSLPRFEDRWKLDPKKIEVIKRDPTSNRITAWTKK